MDKPIFNPGYNASISSDTTNNSANSLPIRILLVDDIAANRNLLAKLLDHQTSMAKNGAVALEMLQNDRFDLVLLAITMSEMDGYEVLLRIKSDAKLRDIPVIMISDLTEMDNVVKCLEIGAEDYFPKPFNPTRLQARINATLEKWRLRKLEQEYRDQTLQAEAMSERHRALAQMVAGVAHEINTPLGIASTAISVIEKHLSSPTLFPDDDQALDIREDIYEAFTLLKNNLIVHTNWWKVSKKCQSGKYP